MPWSERERRLSWGKAVPGPSHPESRHRQPYEPPAAVVRRQGVVPYAELHCHTNFSFLDGASHPEELVEEAARLGLEALAVTDHDGMYGVVRLPPAPPPGRGAPGGPPPRGHSRRRPLPPAPPRRGHPTRLRPRPPPRPAPPFPS